MKVVLKEEVSKPYPLIKSEDLSQGDVVVHQSYRCVLLNKVVVSGTMVLFFLNLETLQFFNYTTREGCSSYNIVGKIGELHLTLFRKEALL